VFALDTNVLAYAEGVNGPGRQADAIRILSLLPARRGRVPVQVLGELHAVLVRKARRTGVQARAAVLAWQSAFATLDTTAETVLDATDLAARHQIGTWDSVILATAAAAGCRHLLSEGMQPGFAWRGVTVVNPFAPGWRP
jgi:predicted nucleic acid-binding protein